MYTAKKLQKLTNDQLKEICGDLGLSTSGLKDDLVQRILDAQAESEDAVGGLDLSALNAIARGQNRGNWQKGSDIDRDLLPKEQTLYITEVKRNSGQKAAYTLQLSARFPSESEESFFDSVRQAYINVPEHIAGKAKIGMEYSTLLGKEISDIEFSVIDVSFFRKLKSFYGKRNMLVTFSEVDGDPAGIYAVNEDDLTLMREFLANQNTGELLGLGRLTYKVKGAERTTLSDTAKDFVGFLPAKIKNLLTVPISEGGFMRPADGDAVSSDEEAAMTAALFGDTEEAETPETAPWESLGVPQGVYEKGKQQGMDDEAIKAVAAMFA